MLPLTQCTQHWLLAVPPPVKQISALGLCFGSVPSVWNILSGNVRPRVRSEQILQCVTPIYRLG